MPRWSPNSATPPSGSGSHNPTLFGTSLEVVRKIESYQADKLASDCRVAKRLSSRRIVDHAVDGIGQDQPGYVVGGCRLPISIGCHGLGIIAEIFYLEGAIRVPVTVDVGRFVEQDAMKAWVDAVRGNHCLHQILRELFCR